MGGWWLLVLQTHLQAGLNMKIYHLKLRMRIPLDEVEVALLLAAEQMKQMQVYSKPHAVASVSVSPQKPQYVPVLKGATALALYRV